MSGPGSSNGREFDMIREVLGLYSTYCGIFSAKFDYLFVRRKECFCPCILSISNITFTNKYIYITRASVENMGRKTHTITCYIPLGFTPCPTIWKKDWKWHRFTKISRKWNLIYSPGNDGSLQKWTNADKLYNDIITKSTNWSWLDVCHYLRQQLIILQ